MKKACRLNLRLTDVQYRQVERRAQSEGMSAAEYIRLIVDADLSTDTDAVVRRLARQILFTSVAIKHLLKSYDCEEDLHTVAEEVRRLSDRLGLHHG